MIRLSSVIQPTRTPGPDLAPVLAGVLLGFCWVLSLVMP